MLAAWLKALHIAALSIWAGGLLALPGIMAREHRTTSSGPSADLGPLWQHRVSRFAYDVIISPAAVVAIASGTALLFVTRPLEGWMFVKLAAVGGLVATHMFVGRIIDQIESPELRPTPRLATAILVAAIVFICLILWLVLQKPAIPESLFPRWLLHGPDALPVNLPIGQGPPSTPLTPT